MTTAPTLAPEDRSLLEQFCRAIESTWNEEGDLLERRVSERAVTHRIALYLQALFPRHAVDCEYNRNADAPKTIEIPMDTVSAQKRQKLIESAVKGGMPRDEAEQLAAVTTNPLPDLIVHRRLSNKHNLLIAEIKVPGDSRGEEGRLYDLAKLRAFTQPHSYGYRLGVFADIGATSADLTLVQNGQVTSHPRLLRGTFPAVAANPG